MGTYTSFRGKVKIKEEYTKLVQLINEHKQEEAILKYPFMKDFYEVKRSNQIPFTKEEIEKQKQHDGSWSRKGEIILDADPADWKSDSTYFTDLQGLEWTFIASLQDLRDEKHGNKTPIQTFMDVVLANVVSEIILLEANCDILYGPVQYDFDPIVVNTITKKEKEEEEDVHPFYYR